MKSIKSIMMGALLAASLFADGVMAVDFTGSAATAKAYAPRDAGKSTTKNAQQKKKRKAGDTKKKERSKKKNRSSKAPDSPRQVSQDPAQPQSTQNVLPEVVTLPDDGQPPAPNLACCVCYGGPSTDSNGKSTGNAGCEKIKWNGRCAADRIFNCTVVMVEGKIKNYCRNPNGSWLEPQGELPNPEPRCSEVITVVDGADDVYDTNRCVTAMIDFKNGQGTSLTNCSVLGECKFSEDNDKSYLCTMLRSFSENRKKITPPLQPPPDLTIIFTEDGLPLGQNVCYDVSGLEGVSYYKVTIKPNGAVEIQFCDGVTCSPKTLDEICPNVPPTTPPSGGGGGQPSHGDPPPPVEPGGGIKVVVHFADFNCPPCNAWSAHLAQFQVHYSPEVGGAGSYPLTKVTIGTQTKSYSGNLGAKGARALKEGRFPD